MRLLLTLLLLMTASLLFGQHLNSVKQYKEGTMENRQWKELDYHIYALATDPLGNRYMASTLKKATPSSGLNTPSISINGFGSDKKILLRKENEQGELIWRETVYTSHLDDKPGNIVADKEGNLYVMGTFNKLFRVRISKKTVDIRVKGEHSIYLMKWSPKGELLWAKSFGGLQEGKAFAEREEENSTAIGRALALSPQGDLYLAGVFSDTVQFEKEQHQLVSKGKSTGFVTKLNPEGQVLWAKTVATGGTSAAQHLAIDPMGNVGVAGTFRNKVRFEKMGKRDAGFMAHNTFLLLLSPKGKITWVQTSEKNIDAQANGLAVDQQGNFTLAAKLAAPPPPTQSMNNKILSTQLFSYDNKGEKRWQHIFSEHANLADLAIDAQNSLYLVGHFKKTFTFTANEESKTLTPKGQTDAFVIKLDASNKISYSTSLYGDQETVVHLSALALTQGEPYYLAGFFKGKLCVDEEEKSYKIAPEANNGLVLKMGTKKGRFFPPMATHTPTKFPLLAQKEYSTVLQKLWFDPNKGWLPQLYNAEPLDLEAVLKTEPAREVDPSEIEEEESAEEKEQPVYVAPPDTLYTATGKVLLPLEKEGLLTITSSSILTRQSSGDTFIINKYTHQGELLKTISRATKKEHIGYISVLTSKATTYFYYTSKEGLENSKEDLILVYNEDLEEVFQYRKKEEHNISLSLKGIDSLVIVEALREAMQVRVTIVHLPTQKVVLEKDISTRSHNVKPHYIDHAVMQDTIHLLVANYVSEFRASPTLLLSIDDKGNPLGKPSVFTKHKYTDAIWPQKQLLFVGHYNSNTFVYDVLDRQTIETVGTFSHSNMKVTASGEYLYGIVRTNDKSMGAYVYNNYQLLVTNGKVWKSMHLPKDIFASRGYTYSIQDNVVAIHLDQYVLVYDLDFDKVED